MNLDGVADREQLISRASRMLDSAKRRGNARQVVMCTSAILRHRKALNGHGEISDGRRNSDSK